MKLVSSKETFDFHHTTADLIQISPTPVKVSDEAATHIDQVFGGLVQIAPIPGDEPTVVPAEDEKSEAQADRNVEQPQIMDEPTVVPAEDEII